MTDKGFGLGEVEKRLIRLRELMRESGIDLLIVRGTDCYLNEYVPAAESLRLWLTGFTGSVGDALVAADKAYVFVDGRYYLQAEAETDPRLWEVVRVPFGVGIEDAVERKLAELAREGTVIGFEPDRYSLVDFAKLRAVLERKDARLAAPEPNLVSRVRGDGGRAKSGRLEVIPDALTGESSLAKLARVREVLERSMLSGVMLTRLDEIAWLLNLRAYEIDYASTFRGRAYVGREMAILFVDREKVTREVEKALHGRWLVEPENDWARTLGRHLAPLAGLRVSVDPAGTTVAVAESLRALLGDRGKVVEGVSPVVGLKARKNARELKTVSEAYERADQVVAQVVTWLNRRVSSKQRVTERDLADKVEEQFLAAGARSLSFRVIAAAGANGAVIHYSNPDPDRRIKLGELVLLDTGAYFESGYATDLTRTFLAGSGAKPTKKQKEIFTLVLKGAVRGMMARFPVGTTGVQLDALVRGPIWDGGYDYLHGTGHGIGVLVHEFPPRVSTKSMVPLEAGMVFSIEPGIYIPGWGGVRIENLVTVEDDPVIPGYLRVRPLTFSPLDRRLIEPKLLSLDEKTWLRSYLRGRVPTRRRKA